MGEVHLEDRPTIILNTYTNSVQDIGANLVDILLLFICFQKSFFLSVFVDGHLSGARFGHIPAGTILFHDAACFLQHQKSVL
ncbi:hypothetical protein K1719_041093 [Acacia pycnantha]|nr:hypothetical protein K1719_041093 [Acacia pycnantha]